MIDSPENHNPFAKNILLAMGHRELASDDFIAFRAAREELAAKLADEFSGEGRMYGATPTEHKHAMDRLAFYYLVKLIFQQKLSLWYRNSQASGYASYASKALSEEDMREEKNSEYESFIARIGGIDKVKFDTLVGGVSIPDSEEKITIDGKAVYQFGRLKQDKDKYWRFSLHDDFTPTGLGDDPASFHHIERKSVSVTKQVPGGGKKSEQCINYTFRMAGNVCCPYAEYSEFSNPSLPVDSDFLEYGRTFIPENNTDEFYLYIEGFFYLFLASHLLRPGNDSQVSEGSYKQPILRLFAKAILAKIDVIEKMFENRAYLQRGEADSIISNRYQDVIKNFSTKLILSANAIKKDDESADIKKSNELKRENHFAKVRMAWLEYRDKFTSDEEKMYCEFALMYCDLKIDHIYAKIVQKFFKDEVDKEKDLHNEHKRIVGNYLKRIKRIAERNGLPQIPKRRERKNNG